MKRAIITLSAVVGLSALAGHAQAESYSADVWADNWFSLNVNGTQVAEDSVPITTERSFNAESFDFTAERPFVLALEAKDFKENDTGLEYIGTNRQQMGDGGVILQIKDALGERVVVSNDGWQCLVIHEAPLDKACERSTNPAAGEGACDFIATGAPDGWDTLDFDATGWPAATEHSAADVGPKDGYDRITWDANAQLIWGPDLETDNTILCRFVVE